MLLVTYYYDLNYRVKAKRVLLILVLFSALSNNGPDDFIDSVISFSSLTANDDGEFGKLLFCLLENGLKT